MIKGMAGAGVVLATLAGGKVGVEAEAEAEDVVGQPTETEQELAARELVERVEALAAAAEEDGGSDGLQAGVERLAQVWKVSEAQVWDAMSGAEGEAVAIKTLEGVLRGCMGVDWLNEAEGRNGEPMTRAEAGLLDVSKLAAAEQVVVDGHGKAASKARWWSRF